MATVDAGYMGYAVIDDDTKVRCTDFNVKLTQEALFYDHTIGLRDSIPTDISGGKGDNGDKWNEQKVIYRPGTKIVEGSINFPLLESSADAFFLQAANGDTIEELTLYYSCRTGKTFKGCKVNTYSFTATAGEGGNVSVGIMGAGVGEGGSPEIFEEPEKTITWDKIKINGAGVDSGQGIVSIEFTINNNCIPIYTAGRNVTEPKLEVKDIRVGMQLVTGSVTFYNDLGPEDEFVEDVNPRQITIKAGKFSARLTVLYQYPERTGGTGAYVRTIPFVGVNKAVQ